MSAASSQDAGSRAKRHKTRYRGITYRQRTDGSRTYFVTWGNSYLKAGSTEGEAVALQSSLKSKKARGERVVLASKPIGSANPSLNNVFQGARDMRACSGHSVPLALRSRSLCRSSASRASSRATRPDRHHPTRIAIPAGSQVNHQSPGPANTPSPIPSPSTTMKTKFERESAISQRRPRVFV